MKRRKWFYTSLAGLALSGIIVGNVIANDDLTMNQEVKSEVSQTKSRAAEVRDPKNWKANSVETVVKELAAQKAKEDGRYTIRWGDTLWAISQATGMSIADIASLNNIQNPDLIYADDLLSLVFAQTSSNNEEKSVLYSPQAPANEPAKSQSANETVAEEDSQAVETIVLPEAVGEQTVTVTPTYTEAPETPLVKEVMVEVVVEETPVVKEVVEEVVVIDAPLEEEVVTTLVSEETKEVPEESIGETASETLVAETPVVEEVTPEETNVLETSETPKETEVESKPIDTVSEPVTGESPDPELETSPDLTKEETQAETQAETPEATSELTPEETAEVTPEETPVESSEATSQPDQETSPETAPTVEEPVNTAPRPKAVAKETVTVETVTKEITLGFQEEQIHTNELLEGETQVIQEGSNGLQVDTYEVTKAADGSIKEEKLVSSTVQKQPTNRVVQIGTRKPVRKTVMVPATIYAPVSNESVNQIANKFGVSPSNVYNQSNTRRATGTIKPGEEVTIRYAQAKPMKEDGEFSVYLDVGHGGREPGAVGIYEVEKDYNLMMTNKLNQRLKETNIPNLKVYQNRTTDRYIDLNDRPAEANKMDADVFISVHSNAMGGPSKAQGIETYYYRYNTEYPSEINQAYHNDPQRLVNSAYLTNRIHTNLIQNTGAVDRGERASAFRVIKESQMPAVLLEFGFMDHPTEAKKLTDPAYQNKLIEGTVEGVVQYWADLYNDGVRP